MFTTAGSSETVVGTDGETYQQEVDAWRKARVERLTSEEGWLAVVGLLWLEEGFNSLGSSPTNDLVFATPKAPATIGAITLQGTRVRFEAAPSVVVTRNGEPVRSMDLQPDVGGNPTILDLGDLRFHLIERAG